MGTLNHLFFLLTILTFHLSEGYMLRLVEGTAVSNGRLEVSQNGTTWGTICKNMFGDKEARVACRQLGYHSGSVQNKLEYEKGTGSVYLVDVQCTGSETNIEQCSHSAWGTGECGQREDVAVVCSIQGGYMLRLVEGTAVSNGRLEVSQNGTTWGTICKNMFGDKEARVACRQLGYHSGSVQNKLEYEKGTGSVYLVDVQCTGSETNIEQCSHSAWGTGECGQREDVAVVCSIQGGVVSLHPDQFPAKIVIQQHGINGTICPDGWTEEAARVYCGEIGYQNGYTIGPTYSTAMTPLIENVRCTGLETSLSQCDFTSPTDIMCQDRAVQVYCYMDSSQGLGIRLTGGRNAVEGRVEISVDGVWGVVCDGVMNEETASVVCRQLGYVSGSQSVINSNSSAHDRTWISNPSCFGDEKYLWECPMDSFDSRSICRSSQHAVHVTCTDKVRLAPSSSHGAVQVFSAGSYGLVCADGFSDAAAGVVCREVGYTYGINICCSAYGTGKLPLVMTNVRCIGNELSLLDCQYDTSLSECPSLTYASVVCSNNPPSAEYEVSLNQHNFGAVRIRHFGILGYVCPEGFDDNDANVICKQLGFVGGFAYNSYHYRRGLFDDTRWLSHIHCQGNETSSRRCTGPRFGNIGYCSSTSDAAAYCYNNQAYQIRLSSAASRGRVEINIDGTWGTVCGTFTDIDATVLCRQLNYRSGIAADSSVFGMGSGPVYVSHVRCRGPESQLFQCPLTWNAGTSLTPSCKSHTSDVAVQCYNDVRLTNAFSTTYGRLEVFSNNEWLAVCDDGFTDNMASIVCKQLRFSYGTSQCCSAVGLLDSSRQLLSVKCQGTEENILDCALQPNQCSSGTYVSVNCSLEEIIITDLQIRLPGKGSYYGRVEANQFGFWGPICDIGWDKNAADVVCKELGFVEGQVFSGVTYDHVPMMLGKFHCSGNEVRLRDCIYSDRNDNLGCHYGFEGPRQSAGVLCSNHTDSFKLYLSEGGSQFGKVIISFNGESRPICSAYLPAKIAPVVCRQMGYIDGSEYFGKVADTGLTKTWLASVMCRGDESSILQCQGVWDQQSSMMCEQPSVICYSTVKLSPDYTSSGAVEVFINDNWGVVCNHEWNDQNAKVVCRQLGYDNGISACCGAFGRANKPAMIDRVSCTGSENDLLECTHDAPLTSECELDYAAVACFNGALDKSYTSLQLGSYVMNNNMGHVQLNVSGIAGRICIDDWDDVDASVVCRELGFATGQAYTHMRNSYESKSWGVFITSNVQCRGDESSLNDCVKDDFGTVTSCSSDHYAGVLCYETGGISYRLSGGTASEGRLDVSYDGVWGSLCNTQFTDTEAGVYCRSIGYQTGEEIYPRNTEYGAALSVAYESVFRCTGNEIGLNQCAHDRLDRSASCHSFVVVRCFTSVKLLTWTGGVKTNHGPVVIYNKPSDNWLLVCDAGFTDLSAKIVCQELGYADGKAVCCSAYSENSRDIAGNYTLSCNGQEESVSECLKNVPCSSNLYASVVCFSETDTFDESYSFLSSQTDVSFEILVEHYNVVGRISSLGWTDVEANVACLQNGFSNGIAFQHQSTDFPLAHIWTQKPYWISYVNCTGTETRLSECSYNTRLNLGNTSTGHGAGILCYNDEGIKYRLADGGVNYGRVELSINTVWGTVCDSFWDENDAKVLCRQLGFADGYALSGAHYGIGSGRIWLSYLTCNGTEEHLYQCPHSGSITNRISMGCESHARDASVYCTGNVRLHSGLNASIGALEIYEHGQWNRVCDKGFSDQEAVVACKTLGFEDGRSIEGSAFGEQPNSIGITEIKCTGTENDVLNCAFTYGTDCRSRQYISLYCDRTPIVDTGFQIKLISESETSKNYGPIEVKIGGIWGRICMDESWDDNTATVACKELGYSGGVSYQAQSDPSNMMMLNPVHCMGSENGLEGCNFNQIGNMQFCSSKEHHAGVFCFKSQDGVRYRLTGGTPLSGRLEISVDGNWGGLCDWQWDSRDARVACRSLGFQDGLAVYGKNFGTTDIPIWFARVQCSGNESSIFNCIHSGFNNTDDFYVKYCSGYYGNAAVRCYDSPIELSGVRLAGGNKTQGRVEVYLRGPDQWGTVCNDYWDNNDATVVCKQLGFELGKSVPISMASIGTGPIWLDDVGCLGNESKIRDCPFSGFSVHDCNHRQDVGVMCSGMLSVTGSGQSVESGASTNLAVTVVLSLLSIIVVIGLVVAYLWYRKRSSSKTPTDSSDKSLRSFTLENFRVLFRKRSSESDTAPTLRNIDIIHYDTPP